MYPLDCAQVTGVNRRRDMRDYPELDGQYCYHLDRPKWRDTYPCDTMYFRRDADPNQLKLCYTDWSQDGAPCVT